ncbi:putative capsid assembly protein [Pelagibacter phage HTVC034P]|nr:putative capsid assembly protein [Pelagibacter phage HTVC034P]
MSSEQITQETVPVEQTTTTETVTPTTEPTTETKPEVTTTTTTTTSSWKESISEQYRNDPNIEKFTEIDALAKSYINATKMIGQDKVVIPTNNSTEEAWNEVYDKLGRPESAEKYSLDAKSEVVNLDETAIKSFAEQSHKLGLNNKQAQGILEFYKNNMESTAQQAKIDTETAQAQAEQELRQEWGRDFESKVKQAGALAKANINSEVLDMPLQNGTRLGDHPDIIRGFSKIASMMQEDKIVATESENVNTTKDLESEISAIMNDKNHPYHIKGHPDHDKSVQQLLTLREMLHAK